jgi:hypothetical protein
VQLLGLALCSLPRIQLFFIVFSLQMGLFLDWDFPHTLDETFE